MAVHIEVGKLGEELAVAWLMEKGYAILHRNWRHGKDEIDIIATKGEYLHFVEVKTRNSSPFGYPEDSVTKKKFKKLQRVADEYLFRNPGHEWIQYDVLAITLHQEKEHEYFLLEDVFL